MPEYNRFYRIFRNKLSNNIALFPDNFNIPNHQNNRAYLGYNTGKSNIKYYTEYTSRGYAQGYIGFIVGVYLDGVLYEERLSELSRFKDKIEADIGQKLDWINTGNAGRIFFILREDITEENIWDEIMDWKIEKLSKIINTFQAYINDL